MKGPARSRDLSQFFTVFNTGMSVVLAMVAAVLATKEPSAGRGSFKEASSHLRRTGKHTPVDAVAAKRTMRNDTSDIMLHGNA